MVKLETSLWYSSLFLKSLSSSPLSPNASSFQKAANLAHFLIILIALTAMFVQITIYIVQNSTNSYFIIEHISIQVAFLQSISKVIMYRVNRRKVFRILKRINNMVKNGSPELKRQLKRYASIGNVVYLSYTSATLIITVPFYLQPLFKPESELPLAAWYPFDYKQSTLLYSFAYFHQICIISMSWLFTGIDVMFGVMVFACGACCNVMQETLRGLNNSHIDELQQKRRIQAGERSTMEFDRKIAKVVDLHCEVLESVQDINDIHTYILLVLFLTSVIMICCAGFQITNASDQHVSELLIFGVIVGYVLFQMLFYFIPGDFLINEAHAVGMAAYDSSWESMPPRSRECLSLIIMQSAKPLKLEGARIEPLILKNYGAFLISTASYFTSLQAVAKID